MVIICKAEDQVLYMESGLGEDFDKCVQEVTEPMPFCMTTGIKSRNNDFMKDRPFRIMACKGGVWLKGRIEFWRVYNQGGPLDPFVRWHFSASMEAASKIERGALVRIIGKNV